MEKISILPLIVLWLGFAVIAGSIIPIPKNISVAGLVCLGTVSLIVIVLLGFLVYWILF